MIDFCDTDPVYYFTSLRNEIRGLCLLFCVSKFRCLGFGLTLSSLINVQSLISVQGRDDIPFYSISQKRKRIPIF